MEMDLGLAVSAGADGLVFGCCKPCAGGWALDELTLGALVMAAGCATEECKREPIDITFHMAFDQLSRSRLSSMPSTHSPTAASRAS